MQPDWNVQGKSSVSFADQVPCCVPATHTQGILHYDLKTSNILRDNITGQIRLADFGLCRLFGFPGTSGSLCTPHLDLIRLLDSTGKPACFCYDAVASLNNAVVDLRQVFVAALKGYLTALDKWPAELDNTKGDQFASCLERLTPEQRHDTQFAFEVVKDAYYERWSSFDFGKLLRDELAHRPDGGAMFAAVLCPRQQCEVPTIDELMSRDVLREEVAKARALREAGRCEFHVMRGYVCKRVRLTAC